MLGVRESLSEPDLSTTLHSLRDQLLWRNAELEARGALDICTANMDTLPGNNSVAGASVAGAGFTCLWVPMTRDKSMFELETLFAPTESLVSKGFDLFSQQVILEAEAKPELGADISYERINEEIRIRKRRSVLGKSMV